MKRREFRIPDDISVTGYDNSLYARRGTGITTIAHPQEKLGEMAAELIMEKINGVAEEGQQSRASDSAGTDHQRFLRS